VGLEFTRCSFSPDAQFCVAGAGDGDLYIWNVATAKLESVLSKEHEAAITAVSWHPSGLGLASSDKHKNVCVWMDY